MRKILILILLAFTLISCTTIKNEIIRSKVGATWEEIKEIKKTSDPNVVLSDGSALVVYAMNKWANSDGTFGQPTEYPLRGDRIVKEVELSSSKLWIAYPKNYKEGDILPVIFYTHGGSYTSSDYSSYQDLVSVFSDRTNSIIFFNDYSLAPEHKFPDAVEDVWEAYNYLLEHASTYNADTSKIVLMGDSAGGNFAAGLAIRAKVEKKTQPCCVILMYPNLSLYPNMLPSHILFGGFDGKKTLISQVVMAKTITDYLENEEDAFKPYASPLLMLEGTLKTGDVENIFTKCAVELDEDSTFVLPDHLIMVAEADSLRDEGVMYHGVLTALKTNSTLSLYKGTVHAFVQLYQILDEGKKGINEAVKFIKDHYQLDNLE